MIIAVLDSAAATLLQRPTVWLVIFVAYLLGAVPFGLIVSRLVKGVDLRTIGSGNIGATNAVRAMGRRWGFAVFALDFLKGFAPVFLAQYLGVATNELPLLQVLCGTAAVLGHCYPIYLRFQGGKGVATGCGAIVAIDPVVFVIGGLVWIATRLSTGFAGLASIMMGIAFPIATWFRGGMVHKELFVGALLLMLLIVIRHRSNIQRMLHGTEPNARTKKREAAAAAASAARPIAKPEKSTAGRHG